MVSFYINNSFIVASLWALHYAQAVVPQNKLHNYLYVYSTNVSMRFYIQIKIGTESDKPDKAVERWFVAFSKY